MEVKPDTSSLKPFTQEESVVLLEFAYIAILGADIVYGVAKQMSILAALVVEIRGAFVAYIDARSK